MSLALPLALFDEATYLSNINWCWFDVRCGDAIATFRLHLDSPECWACFALLNTDKLFQHPDSNAGYSFGNRSRQKRLAVGTERDTDAALLERFAWLAPCLLDSAKTVEDVFDYHGVRFSHVESTAAESHNGQDEKRGTKRERVSPVQFVIERLSPHFEGMTYAQARAIYYGLFGTRLSHPEFDDGDAFVLDDKQMLNGIGDWLGGELGGGKAIFKLFASVQPHRKGTVSQTFAKLLRKAGFNTTATTTKRARKETAQT